MNRIGIESLTVFGLPPVEFVTLAADLGCAHISSGLTAFGYNPQNYPAFSLVEDASLRCKMKTAMRDRGVAISLGEGLTIRPGIEIKDRQREFDVFSELGAVRVNAVSMDPDMNRTIDQFTQMAEMAAASGIETTVEMSPGLTVGDLKTAVAVARKVNRPNFKLLIDSMHLIRSGGSAAELAAIDPSLIGYAQLADAPTTPSMPNYMEEACFERRAIGEGELPLLDILKALPRHITIGIEAPQRSLAEKGLGPRERAAPNVEATRKLLAQLDA